MSRLEILIGILFIVLLLVSYQVSDDEHKSKSEVRQVQKFRFGEQCPDGLRVEYISTIRLPKAVVCQKAVGEE